MGRYKRIKKRTKPKDLLLTPTESAKDWLAENMEKISLGLGAVALTAALLYGVAYYREASHTDAQKKLYEAVSMAPSSNATKAQAESAMASMKKLIDSGGPDIVLAQAHLGVASLLSRSGDYEGASHEYALAFDKAGQETMLREIALAGRANSLFRANKLVESERFFRELSETAQNYPKADALLSLAFVLAGSGKKDEAIGVLNKLKSEHPEYLPEIYLEDTIKHIDTDEFMDISSQDGEPPVSAEKKKQAPPDSNKIQRPQIHESVPDKK